MIEFILRVLIRSLISTGIIVAVAVLTVITALVVFIPLLIFKNICGALLSLFLLIFSLSIFMECS